MSQAENNNQPLQQVEHKTFRQKYDELTDGKKRKLIQDFQANFGYCYDSFFKKLNNRTKVRKPEQMFFINNLY